MPDCLTRLILMHHEKNRRWQLVFGEPEDIREVGGPFAERHVFFLPGQLFGVEFWEANEYGTVSWHVMVLRAVTPGERAHVLKQVTPGAEILLDAGGRKRVREALKWLRDLSRNGQTLAALDPDYYRASHYKLKARLKPRDLTAPCGKVRDLLRR